jgi:hypothetical protein
MLILFGCSAETEQSEGPSQRVVEALVADMLYRQVPSSFLDTPLDEPGSKARINDFEIVHSYGQDTSLNHWRYSIRVEGVCLTPSMPDSQPFAGKLGIRVRQNHLDQWQVAIDDTSQS